MAIIHITRPELTAEERAEYVEIMISACDRLTEMSSSVLLLSKLENQQFITGKHPCDLPDRKPRLTCQKRNRQSVLYGKIPRDG